MSDSSETVVNNTERQRFEVVSGSLVSRLDYRMDGRGEYVTLVHTEVPEELAGQGIGSALVSAALEYARENELQVKPACPFTAAYIERHPEWQDLVREF